LTRICGPAKRAVGRPTRLTDKLYPAHSRDELTQHGLRLHPCQLGAKAQVRAEAECDVLARISVDLVHVGVIEHPWIPVGGAEGQHDSCACRNRHTADGVVRSRGAIKVLRRRREAQLLLDRHGNQVVIRADPVVGVRVSGESIEHAAKEIGGRLLPASSRSIAK
jgi:hypothetical protein